MESYYRLDEMPKKYCYLQSDEENKIVEIYQGDLGSEGYFEEIDMKEIQIRKKQLIKEGFKLVEDDSLDLLEFSFTWSDENALEAIGAQEDLIEDLDEILQSKGLGFCEGGSMEEGRIFLSCFVIDKEMAKKVVEDIFADQDLEGIESVFENV